MLGSYVRKFSSEKLKSPENSIVYKKINECAEKHSDNDDISEARILLKDAMTQIADTVLNRREKHYTKISSMQSVSRQQ